MSRRAVARLAALLLAAACLVAGAAPAAAAPADWVRDGEWWLSAHGIRTAWETTRGEGVRIAIIDSGIARHPALDAAVVDGEDFSGDGSSNGRTPVSDHPDHGTIVASLAAGRGTGGGSGLLGAAPEAELLALSIGYDGGSDRQIAEAVIWAVDHGADVINLSLTRNSLDWPLSWDEAFLYAEQHDVAVVAAAGNRAGGTEVVGAPATLPGVLVVGGMTRGGAASFRFSSQGITIGVTAAAEGLIGALPGGGYRTVNGTSGAAPIVAGVVALVRAAHPELDAANVINRILATARDADPSVLYGHGILDAAAAVRAEVPLVDSNPLGTMEEWIEMYRRADSEARPIVIGDGTRAPGAGLPAPPAPVVRPLPLDPVALQLELLPWVVTGALALLAAALGIVLALRFRSLRAKG